MTSRSNHRHSEARFDHSDFGRVEKARALVADPALLRECYEQYAAQQDTPMPFERFELAIHAVAAREPVERVCGTCGMVVERDGQRQRPPSAIGPWTLCTHVAAVYERPREETP